MTSRKPKFAFPLFLEGLLPPFLPVLGALAFPVPDPFHDLGAVIDADVPVLGDAPQVLGQDAREGLDVRDFVVLARLELFGEQGLHLFGLVGENIELDHQLADSFDHLGPHLGVEGRRLGRFSFALGERGEGRGEKEKHEQDNDG